MTSSTVSNLVRTMSAAGLVERRSRPTDLRAVELSATPTALELLRRYDRASDETLEQAIEKLPPGDRDTLAKALPALKRLVTALESGDQA